MVWCVCVCGVRLWELVNDKIEKKKIGLTAWIR